MNQTTVLLRTQGWSQCGSV